MLPLRYVLLVLGCCLIASLAVAQENSASEYVQQGLQYERAEDYPKALQAYRRARPYAIPSDQKVIDKAIDRVEDLMQQQTLVNQARIDDIRRSVQTLSDPQIRRRLQEDLTALENNDNASLTDYQRLVRRVDAARRVEMALSGEPQSNRPVARPIKPAPGRPPVASSAPVHKPVTPSKKQISVGLPGADAGVFRGSQKAKSIQQSTPSKP